MRFCNHESWPSSHHPWILILFLFLSLPLVCSFVLFVCVCRSEADRLEQIVWWTMFFLLSWPAMTCAVVWARWGALPSAALSAAAVSVWKSIWWRGRRALWGRDTEEREERECVWLSVWAVWAFYQAPGLLSCYESLSLICFYFSLSFLPPYPHPFLVVSLCLAV